MCLLSQKTEILLGRLFTLLMGGGFVFTAGIYASISFAWRHDALICAVARGEMTTVRRLVLFDPYLGRVGFEEHRTPLEAAISAGNTNILRFLLAVNVDVNQKNDYGQTPLTLARLRGDNEVIALLKSCGAK